jgi:hypothetical protein
MHYMINFYFSLSNTPIFRNLNLPDFHWLFNFMCFDSLIDRKLTNLKCWWRKWRSVSKHLRRILNLFWVWVSVKVNIIKRLIYEKKAFVEDVFVSITKEMQNYENYWMAYPFSQVINFKKTSMNPTQNTFDSSYY